MESEQYRLAEVARLVQRHDKDLYYGNGKPGLTTRMALMEDCVNKISRNLSKIVWLIVSGGITGLVALIVDIVVRTKH